MGGSREGDPSSSPLGFFGAELRHHRVRADLTQEQLGQRIAYSNTLVSSVESARKVPSRDFAERCDEALDTGGALTRLLGLVHQSAFPTWLRPWVEAECQAHTLRSWEPLVVPGQLQTEEYARSLLAMHPGASEERVEEQVAARMERQEILDRDEPPVLWFTIDEGVLHRVVDSPKVMREQLQALVEAGDRPNVTTQVVPLSAGMHLGHVGAFVIASFDGSSDVVYLESAGEGQVTDRPEDVRAIANIWEAIRAEALPARASIDLVMKVMEQWI